MTTLRAVSPSSEAGPCRILHLEDSPLDAELIAECLSQAGFRCEIRLVADRGAYIAALGAGQFDLILADYVLPGFDGLAALALAGEYAPETPFIFVSGTLGEEAAAEAVRRGATDYVVKQRLARLPIASSRAMAEARAVAGKQEAMAALRESEARLRLALDAGRLGAWELDLRSLVLTRIRLVPVQFRGANRAIPLTTRTFAAPSTRTTARECRPPWHGRSSMAPTTTSNIGR